MTHVQLIVGGDVIELSLLTYHGPRLGLQIPCTRNTCLTTDWEFSVTMMSVHGWRVSQCKVALEHLGPCHTIEELTLIRLKIGSFDHDQR